MTVPRSLRDRILDFKLTRGMCARLGIDVRQYRLLLDLFAILSGRLEFLGTTIALKSIASGGFVISVLISLVAFAKPSLQNYLLLLLAWTMFFLLWILLEDASHSLLNADEASVLAHQPIAGPTYIAAKLTHLLLVLALFVPVMNVVPAIAALILDGTRWFYPLTHLLAAYLAGLFVAFLVCGIYGWLFRFVPAARLKSAVLWMQVLVALVPYLSNAMLAPVVAKAAASPWLPFRWFAAIGLLGQTASSGFPLWQAGIAVLVTCGLIAFGLRGFTADYLVRVSTMLQGSAPAARRISRTSGVKMLIRKLTGAPSGCGAFAFTGIMLRRDWHFRRRALPMILAYFIVLVGITVQGIKISPFVSGGLSVRSFSPMHIFPACLGIICLMPCGMLAFTAEPRGAWIFTILPFERLRPFVRGIFLSLWLPIVVLTHLCVVIPCIWFWGAGHGLLFVFFSAALASLFLALAFLLVESLPFSSAFSAAKAENVRMGMVLGFLLGALFVGIQWLVFHSVLLVMAASAILLLTAVLVARAGFRKLEKEIRTELKLLQLGPQHLFKETERMT
jgi:hypothetical protein